MDKPSTNWIDEFFAKMERVRERNRREYEALAARSGVTVAQVEADLCVPDPCFEENGDEIF